MSRFCFPGLFNYKRSGQNKEIIKEVCYCHDFVWLKSFFLLLDMSRRILVYVPHVVLWCGFLGSGYCPITLESSFDHTFYLPSSKSCRCRYSSILCFWRVIQNNTVQQIGKKRTKIAIETAPIFCILTNPGRHTGFAFTPCVNIYMVSTLKSVADSNVSPDKVEFQCWIHIPNCIAQVFMLHLKKRSWLKM